MNRRALLTAALLALPAGRPSSPLAGATPHRRRPTGREVWLRTELFFGTRQPGGEVSEEEFARFVDKEVTPRFPDGLTLLTGYGQHLNLQGTMTRERSRVLILFYPALVGNPGKKIDEIREAYKLAYAQESVLRVESYNVVSF